MKPSLLVFLLFATLAFGMQGKKKCRTSSKPFNVDRLLEDRLSRKQRKSRECHVTQDTFATYCIMYECRYCHKEHDRYCFDQATLAPRAGILSLVISSTGCYEDIEFCKLPKETYAECNRQIKNKSTLDRKCKRIEVLVATQQDHPVESRGFNQQFFSQWYNGGVAEEKVLIASMKPYTSTELVPFERVYQPTTVKYVLAKEEEAATQHVVVVRKPEPPRQQVVHVVQAREEEGCLCESSSSSVGRHLSCCQQPATRQVVMVQKPQAQAVTVVETRQEECVCSSDLLVRQNVCCGVERHEVVEEVQPQASAIVDGEDECLCDASATVIKKCCLTRVSVVTNRAQESSAPKYVMVSGDETRSYASCAHPPCSKESQVAYVVSEEHQHRSSQDRIHVVTEHDSVAQEGGFLGSRKKHTKDEDEHEIKEMHKDDKTSWLGFSQDTTRSLFVVFFIFVIGGAIYFMAVH